MHFSLITCPALFYSFVIFQTFLIHSRTTWEHAFCIKKITVSSQSRGCIRHIIIIFQLIICVWRCGTERLHLNFNSFDYHSHSVICKLANSCFMHVRQASLTNFDMNISAVFHKHRVHSGSGYYTNITIIHYRRFCHREHRVRNILRVGLAHYMRCYGHSYFVLLEEDSFTHSTDVWAVSSREHTQFHNENQ